MDDRYLHARGLYIDHLEPLALAAINTFGGFFVSQRMLEMFKRKGDRKDGPPGPPSRK